MKKERKKKKKERTQDFKLFWGTLIFPIIERTIQSEKQLIYFKRKILKNKEFKKQGRGLVVRAEDS